MGHTVVENDGKKYLEYLPDSAKLGAERDALDLVALCIENDTNQLMVHDAALGEDFFDLRTGLAGAILQKFISYNMRTGSNHSGTEAH
jgi:hypothetical protein